MSAPTSPVLDDFSSGDGTPPPGGNWTGIGGGVSRLTADTNRCRAETAAATSSGQWNTATFSAASESHVTLVAMPATPQDGDGFGIFVRISGTDYYVAQYVYDTTGSQIQLLDRADTVIGSFNLEMAATDGLWLRASGNTIQVFYRPLSGSWVEVVSVTDAQSQDGGYVGMLIFGPQADEVFVTDFGGGETAPGWTDESVRVKGKLEVNWNESGDPGDWIDESDYLTSSPGATWNYKLLMPWQVLGGTQQQDAWTATFELFNVDDRYSATNTDGDLYADIGTNKGHGIPMRFSMGTDDGAGGFNYTVVFTGIIDKLSVISTAQDRARMECLDNSHPLQQNRQTTTMYLDDRADEWITALATLGGVASTSLMAGLRVIPFLWLDDEQLWGEMNRVAHSEGGFVYFDQSGTLVFESAEGWLSETRHSVSQHTFSVSRFKDLALNFNWADTYNRVICQYQPRAIKGRQVIWTLEESDRLVLPGEVHTITARYRKPCVATFTPVANVDYRFISATGKDLTGVLVTVSVTAYAQRAVITITNDHPDKALTIFNFQLRGIPIDGYPAGQVLMDATDADMGSSAVSPKALNLSGNEYLQTPDQAGLIATMLRDRVKKCRLTYSIKGQPGIPTLIPGDRVTVVEAGSEVNNAGFIMSINSRFSSGTYAMDLEVLDAASWFLYDDYFELGVSVLGSSDRVFY